VTVIGPTEGSSESQFLAYREKRVPDVEEVVPGVWSIPLPLVQLPIRYVLTYLLETPDGPVLIDAGWPDAESWNALETGIARVGYGVGDLCGLILTHGHPDHHGLAERIRGASKAWVGGHALDVPRGGKPDAGTVERDEFAQLTRAGMPERHARPIAQRFAQGQQIDAIRGPHPDLLIGDGDELPVAGHLCLWLRDRRLLVSGDHVLPKISPSVGLNRADAADPLGDYLASLRRVAELPVDEVLPAHEYRFAGLGDRVEHLLQHHEHRLGELRAVLGEGIPRSAWEIAQRLTWSRPWDEIREWMQRAALFETLAHATLLQLRGETVLVDGDVRLWTLA
jgi:glyoxylase-like metal-dependent hydrolase (beta-lactamase superfamily II)